jgi:porphyrinogen peroxidase
MLANMFLGQPPGNTDRILDFSTALTGNLFFVPSADFLDNPPAPGATSAGDVAPVPETGNDDGSLGIGSLKGTST